MPWNWVILRLNSPPPAQLNRLIHDAADAHGITVRNVFFDAGKTDAYTLLKGPIGAQALRGFLEDVGRPDGVDVGDTRILLDLNEAEQAIR